jgi:hypoxanthine-DNA glycosylase
MGLLFNAGTNIPYEELLIRLHSAGIALWDVLYRCERTGSMDGAIVTSRSLPNNFSSFFEENPGISKIYFNGQKAAHLYERLVMPPTPLVISSLPREMLPSTSPAYATMSLEEKILRWRRGFD